MNMCIKLSNLFNWTYSLNIFTFISFKVKSLLVQLVKSPSLDVSFYGYILADYEGNLNHKGKRCILQVYPAVVAADATPELNPKSTPRGKICTDTSQYFHLHSALLICTQNSTGPHYQSFAFSKLISEYF